MEDRGWIEKIFSIERELGGMQERLRCAENAAKEIKQETKEEFSEVNKTISTSMLALEAAMQRESAHTRGELSRMNDAMTAERTELRGGFERTMNTLRQTLSESVEATVKKSEDKTRNARASELEDQNKVFKEEIDRSRRNTRFVLLIAAGGVAVASKILDVLPSMLAFFDHTSRN